MKLLNRELNKQLIIKKVYYFNFRLVTEMSKSNKEKKDKLHKVKSAKDKRKENKTFLKTIKSNYQDQEFLESLQNKE